MSKKVMCEISIQHEHPILYNDYSICELVKNSKLSNFSIKVFNDICTSFGLELSRLIKLIVLPIRHKANRHCGN